MGNRGLWLGIGALAAVIGAGVLFFYPHTAVTPGVACTMEAKMCPDGSSVGRTGPQCEFAACPTPTLAWIFSDKGTDEATGVPHTQVSLTMNDKRYDAGTYEGNCSQIASANSSWQLLAGEQSGVICWWAGGGIELGVFEENGKLLIKKGLLDEGGEQTPGLRGNFETLLPLL